MCIMLNGSSAMLLREHTLATESSRKVFSSALRQNEGGTDFQRKEIYQPIIIFHSSLLRRGMFICLAIFIYKETQRFRRHVKEVTLKKKGNQRRYINQFKLQCVKFLPLDLRLQSNELFFLWWFLQDKLVLVTHERTENLLF